MSNTDLSPKKEEEKKEIIPEIIEKEKTNMKITIIPRVIVNGSSQNQESKEEIKEEKITPQNQEKKIEIENEEKENTSKDINSEQKEEITPGNLEKENQEKKEEKIEEEKKEENKKEIIEDKTEENQLKDYEKEKDELKIKKVAEEEIKVENNTPKEDTIQKDDSKEEKRKENDIEMTTENTQNPISETNKKLDDGWGNADTNSKNKESDNSTNKNDITGWGDEQNQNDIKTNSNNNSNDNQGWGNSEQNNNSNGDWGNSDSNKNNNSGWGDSNENQNHIQNENKMEIEEDDHDIREDIGPLPEAKCAADTFALCEEEKKDENKMTWFNRDGRDNKNDYYIQKNMNELMKEHESLLSRKEDKIEVMESLEFKAYFVKIYSDEEPKELKEEKRPKIRFENMNKLPEQLAKNIKQLKFDYLTPIQRMVMPYIQVGKDIVCVAETGSGKTIAYLFPIIGQMLITGVPENPFLPKEAKNEGTREEINIENNTENISENKKNHSKPPFKSKIAFPLSLILVPTRELAIQVSKESKKLSFNTGIRTVAIYGGEGKRLQVIELSKGCDIMVATPGRLIDLLDKNVIDLRMVKHLILDEADRMLDQNFYPDLKKIFEKIPKRKNRQNLLFSATFNDDVKGLAKYCLNNYYFFKPLLESPKQIKHEFLQVQNDDDKVNCLKDFLKKEENKDKSILIFLRTKSGVDELGKILKEEGIKCCVIHGDKVQQDRNRSISDFSSGKNNVLVATDVASRGLDFPNVYCVINFDLPQTTDDYIHRVGRSGRAGQEGRALTFIDGIDITNREKLVNFLRNQNQEVPDWLNELVSDKKFKFFGTNSKRKRDNNGNNDGNNFNENNGNDDKEFKKPFKKRRNDDSNSDGWDSNNNNNISNDNGGWNSNNDNNSNSWGTN